MTTGELEGLQQNLSEEVAKKTQEIIRQQDRLNQINRQIVMTLSNAIDAKDAYTNGHSRRVAEYAREIATRYGYDERRQEDVYMIGLLHDVGKIGIPDGLKGDEIPEIAQIISVADAYDAMTSNRSYRKVMEQGKILWYFVHMAAVGFRTR